MKTLLLLWGLLGPFFAGSAASGPGPGFEQALLKVVNHGKDTDTTGAIAGGIAALYYGFDAIPKSWTFDIKKYMTILSLCEKAEQAVQNGKEDKNPEG